MLIDLVCRHAVPYDLSRGFPSSVVLMREFSLSRPVNLRLIEGRMSGIMGLAFQGAASTGALPFWQALVNDGQLTIPELSFHMTRFVNDPFAKGQEEPRGVFTLGGTNNTFFDDDPDFQPFPSAVTEGSAWFQTVSSE